MLEKKKEKKAKCNVCGKEYVIVDNIYGTSTLLCHIPKHTTLLKFHNIGVIMLDLYRKLSSKQLDHKCVCRGGRNFDGDYWA